MAKKANKCCFCDKQSVGDYGAVNDDTKKYLCINCVVELYQVMQDELKQQEMDYSVKEEE